MAPALNIEILGINKVDQGAANGLITSVHKLPWLQPTAEENVEVRWQATYRDVRILDSRNHLRAVFNLDAHNLADDENRTELKRLLLGAAAISDSDRDQLPDDWEIQYFGNLSATALADPDQDGANNFAEFALGTDPTRADSTRFVATFASAPANAFQLRFRRRAGSVLDYFIEASPDLSTWTRTTAAEAPRILFDGTGTAEVSLSINSPAGAVAHGFFRVRALPNAQP